MAIRFLPSLLLLLLLHSLSFGQQFSVLPLGTQGWNIETVDVDGDGRNDIAFKPQNPDNVPFRWLKNTFPAAPGLAVEIPFPSNAPHFHVGFADMDQDQKADLILLSGSGGPWDFTYTKLLWQKNLGNATFGSPQLIQSFDTLTPLLKIIPGNLHIEDVNGDSKPDFLLHLSDVNPVCIVPHYLGQLKSQSNADYSLGLGVLTNGQFPLDNTVMRPVPGPPGAKNYLVHASSSYLDALYREEPADPNMWPANVDFQITETRSLGNTSNQTTLADVGPLVSDSLPDVAVWYKLNFNNDAYKLGYFTQLPDGTFSPFTSIETGSAKYTDLRICDLDQDGLRDLLAFRNQQLVWYKNLGSGSFSPIVLLENIGPLSDMQLADLDLDGDIDMVCYDASQQSMLYLENGGNQQASVSGMVYWDQNQNCFRDETAASIQPSLIRFTPGNYLAASFSSGRYFRYLPPGVYTSEILNPPIGVVLNQVCSDSSLSFSLDSGQHANLDLGLQGTGCAYLSLSGSSPGRVPCRRTQTHFTVANQGMGNATQVVLRVKLPDFARYLGFSSSRFFSQGMDPVSGEYLFRASLIARETASITIVDSNSCVLSIIDQPYCTQASIDYQGKCIVPAPDWDKSDLVVEAQCQSDGQAAFEIRNRGIGNMSDSSAYRLLSAQGIAAEGRVKLMAGQSMGFAVPATSQFLQMEVQQRPNHPFGATTSAISPPCAGGDLQPGLILPFASGNESNEEQTQVCGRVLSSLDPNDKQVRPLGWGAEGNVGSGTELQYRIRFENKGNAAAHYVQIRDTLSPQLDVASIRHLSSSHPGDFRFSLEGSAEQAVLVFTFPTIVLPDSASDREGSQGYVAYAVSLKPGLPQGTAIRNRAFITFDINTPIETNTTLNTVNDSVPVGPPLVLGLHREDKMEAFRMQPNPTRDRVEIQFSKTESGHLQIWDAQGRCLAIQGVDARRSVPLNLGTLPPGIYLVQFRNRDNQLSQARLVVE
jgi:hypothetical protein